MAYKAFDEVCPGAYCLSVSGDLQGIFLRLYPKPTISKSAQLFDVTAVAASQNSPRYARLKQFLRSDNIKSWALLIFGAFASLRKIPCKSLDTRVYAEGTQSYIESYKPLRFLSSVRLRRNPSLYSDILFNNVPTGDSPCLHVTVRIFLQG